MGVLAEQPDETPSPTLVLDARQHLSPEGLTRGASVGPYLVLDRLGQGGMGVVYAAYDPRLDRRVALKLLLPRDTGGNQEEAKHRLQAEAKAMARLCHPNVVPVHDVGEFEGRVFIAMELVEGGATLRTWLREARRDWRDIVRVFAEAGRGLAAAHAAGLVHRDFKPDNVLVGRDGRVYVTDFGLARPGRADTPAPGGPASDAGGAAGAGPGEAPSAPAGTPGYMAPEQYLGEPLDGRADAFSFCVSLYTALHGQPPFAGSTPAALVQAALEGKVRRPPRDSRVPVWLHRVVLQGLSAHRSARFPSMDALLAALQESPAVRYRRRALGVGVLCLLAGGVALHAFAAERERAECQRTGQALAGIWDEARRADMERAFLGTGRPDAPQTWRRVRTALDRYTLAWSQQRTESCLAERAVGEAGRKLLALRAACLEERRTEVRALTDVLLGADARMLDEAVTATGTLPAIEPCADEGALYRQVPLPESAERRARVEALRGRLAQARAHGVSGKVKEGLEAAGALLPEARALGYQPLEAEVLVQLAELQRTHGADGEAERMSRAALAAAEASHHDEVKARAIANLVRLLSDNMARAEEASPWFEHGLALLSRMPRNDRLAWMLHGDNGWAYYRQGRLAEAEEHFRRALSLAEGALGPDSMEAAVSHSRLGSVAWSRGDHAQALASQQRALLIYERALGPEHPRVGAAAHTVGTDHLALGQPAEALRAFLRARAIYARALLPTHPNVFRLKLSIAETLQELGRPEEALASLQDALDVSARELGADHPEVAAAHGAMAFILQELGREDEALGYFERAHALATRALPASHPGVVDATHDLGVVHVRAGRAHRAVPLLERALAAAQDGDAPTTKVGRIRFHLAEALWASGKDRPRARRLALEARDELVGDGVRQTREELEAWLRQRAR